MDPVDRAALSPTDAKWVLALDTDITIETWHGADVDNLLAGSKQLPKRD